MRRGGIHMYLNSLIGFEAFIRSHEPSKKLSPSQYQTPKIGLQV